MIDTLGQLLRADGLGVIVALGFSHPTDRLKVAISLFLGGLARTASREASLTHHFPVDVLQTVLPQLLHGRLLFPYVFGALRRSFQTKLAQHIALLLQFVHPLGNVIEAE